MTVRSCTFIACFAAALAVACESRNSPPVGPSTLQSRDSAATLATPGQMAATAVQHAANAAQHAVTLFDACDPDTFNVAIGRGACTRNGGVTFENFVAQLTRHHSVGAWHFAPSEVTMRVGQLLVANNRGGETHTFTEVEEFGGGNIQFLNDLVGLTTVAPECKNAVDIPSGGSSSETEHEAGVEKYQCCIHPWMRAEVRITEK
jgi:plastocyanin